MAENEKDIQRLVDEAVALEVKKAKLEIRREYERLYEKFFRTRELYNKTEVVRHDMDFKGKVRFSGSVENDTGSIIN